MNQIGDPAPHERPSSPASDRTEGSVIRHFVLLLAFYAALVACPVVLVFVAGPMFGAVAAGVSVYVWIRFGPRPFPGLFPGLLCIWGLLGLVALILWCVHQAARARLD